MQPRHAPLPSHTRAPPHEVPWARGGFEATPAVHTSPVQALPSVGTSVLLIELPTAPAPSQISSWQFPAVCVAILVPEATSTVPQKCATQVAVMQTLPVAGQSPAMSQLPAIPPVPEPLLLALLVAEPPPPIPPVPVEEPPPPPSPPVVLEVVLDALEVDPVVELDTLDVLSPVVEPVVVPPVSESLPQPIAEGRRARVEAMASWRGVMRMMATWTLPQARVGVGGDRRGSGDATKQSTEATRPRTSGH